ncbi:MAG: methyltransferase domain-containing protein [Leptospiraceae bacterium]|nr:methyltransferase domain-containing protein [Leptospiraceae bacterium]
MSKYDYQINLDHNNASSKLLKLVNPKSNVLEIGTSTGSMTAYLKEKLGCSIYGIEIDEKTADLARKYLDFQIIGDIEVLDLENYLKDKKFDIILCADVLEHLKQPDLVLEKLKKYLTQDGKILISVPNITYIGVLLPMIHGRFNYRETGILDETHLKFFSIESFETISKKSGLIINSIDRVQVNASDSDFRLDIKKYPSFLIDYLINNNTELFTYQFIFQLSRDNNSKSKIINNLELTNSELLKSEKDIAKEYNTLLTKYSELNSIHFEYVKHFENIKVTNSLLINNLKQKKTMIIFILLLFGISLFFHFRPYLTNY